MARLSRLKRPGAHRSPSGARARPRGTSPAELRRRRTALRAIILGRAIPVTERDFAVEQARDIVSRLPHATLQGIIFLVMAASSVAVLSEAGPVELALGAACLAIYLGCMAAGLRVWLWSRTQPDPARGAVDS